MKRVMIAVLSFVAVGFLYSGGRGENAKASPLQADKPAVAVSIRPQAFFAERIAGGQLEIITLVGPGQSPHNYEPSPRGLADLSRARLWLTIGVEFETALKPKIGASFKNVAVVDSTAGIRFRQLEAQEHEPGIDDHGGGETDDHDDAVTGARDPHVWLGPTAAKILAANMAEAFAAIDPPNNGFYRANARSLSAEIDTVIDGLHRELEPLRGQTVLVYHPAFGYFLDEFGLIQAAVETGGKEPTPKQLGALIAEARRLDVRTVFAQSQFPATAARNVAAAIGGIVVEIDSLAYDWIENVKAMGAALRAGLTSTGVSDGK